MRRIDVAVALLFTSGVSGCLGTAPDCTDGIRMERDPTSHDFDACGVILHWDGDRDSFEIRALGQHAPRWSDWTLVTRTLYDEPPQARRLGIAFNMDASARSRTSADNVPYPLAEVARDPMLVGDRLSLCIHQVPPESGIVLDLEWHVPDWGTRISFYPFLAPCQ